jgi:hypothetical protein
MVENKKSLLIPEEEKEGVLTRFSANLADEVVE